MRLTCASHRLCRLLSGLVVNLLACATILDYAEAAASPGFECRLGGQVAVFTPPGSVASSSDELVPVFWLASLYKWDGQAWQSIGSGPMLVAAAGRFGLQFVNPSMAPLHNFGFPVPLQGQIGSYWFTATDGRPINPAVIFSNLSLGYYRVRELFWLGPNASPADTFLLTRGVLGSGGVVQYQYCTIG